MHFLDLALLSLEAVLLASLEGGVAARLSDGSRGQPSSTSRWGRALNTLQQIKNDHKQQ